MKKISADRIVSISAIVVSLGTLFIILYQTNLTRQEQKASVMPYLQFAPNTNSGMSNIYLENKGLGPALITNYRIFNQEQEYQSVQELTADYALDKIPGSSIDMVYPGRLLASDEYIKHISHFHNDSTNFIFENFQFFYGSKDEQKLIIEVVYQSVYKDHWMIRSNWRHPRPVDAKGNILNDEEIFTW